EGEPVSADALFKAARDKIVSIERDIDRMLQPRVQKCARAAPGATRAASGGAHIPAIANRRPRRARFAGVHSEPCISE
ncbi:hypothetical protein DF186_15070, partial [Enterococcus hirae]